MSLLALGCSATALPPLHSSANWTTERLLSISSQAAARDFYLRIMPLGASITRGDPHAPGDPHGNGYRKALRDKLRADGWKVNMVGNVNYGDMADNDNEGWPGYRVSEVSNKASTSVPLWKPNLILINAGTNDAGQDGSVEPVATTGLRMKALLENIFKLVPDTIVIFSTLLPNNGPKPVESVNAKDVSRQYRALYREMIGSDESKPRMKILLADMDDGFITLNDIWDGAHPTMEGARKMAAVWMRAINQANEKNWFSKPRDDVSFVDGDGKTTCEKRYTSGNDDPRGHPQILSASDPLIVDDGPYVHRSTLGSTRMVSPRGSFSNERRFYAQLVDFGAPRAEGRDDGKYSVSRLLIFRTSSHGDGSFDAPVDIDVKDGCPVKGVRWGDVNNDGFDDFICIAPTGEIFVSLNTAGIGQTVPTFRSLGSYHPAIAGFLQERVFLGDIDGDGRVDYCVIHDNEDMQCFRNGGIGEMSGPWEDMGIVFVGKGMGDFRGFRLVDLNGDGRSDLLWISAQGAVTTYINQRGEGKGLAPRWLSAGVTHSGVGEDVGDTRFRVQFGRIYGSGRRDYAHIASSIDQASNTYRVRIFRNLGTGGKYQKGDGAFWGDTTGTGFDDYVWISPVGVVSVFRNKNTKTNFDNYQNGGSWEASISFATGLDRRALHIGDWDGDGKADIIGVTDRKSGLLRIWFNHWNGKDFGWTAQDIAGSAFCNQGWGIGYSDNGHHFADISGNGRIDYLCMEPNGRTTALINEPGGLRNVGQVKASETDTARYRADLKFADVNGEGRADMIWTDKFTGDAITWPNQGEVAAGNSKFTWLRTGPVYQGSSRGSNLHFPSLQGQGRADMVEINPTTGHGWLYFNSCPNGGDDVAGAIPDPNLPVYTPKFTF
ncbi:carbohydrate esterase family 3 protein [Cadophora sp. DSE1049]|nr:carbohydrate esterase family 3 protein [Cadophora sp. DSE1049]